MKGQATILYSLKLLFIYLVQKAVELLETMRPVQSGRCSLVIGGCGLKRIKMELVQAVFAACNLQYDEGVAAWLVANNIAFLICHVKPSQCQRPRIGQLQSGFSPSQLNRGCQLTIWQGTICHMQPGLFQLFSLSTFLQAFCQSGMLWSVKPTRWGHRSK